MIRLLGALTLQLSKDHFPVLLEYAKASFERIKQRFPARLTMGLFVPDGRERAPLLASQEKNEWPREDHTNPFAQPERTGIVRVHQKSQDQPGAKVEPGRRTTAPDRRAHYSP